MAQNCSSKKKNKGKGSKNDSPMKHLEEKKSKSSLKEVVGKQNEHIGEDIHNIKPYEPIPSCCSVTANDQPSNNAPESTNSCLDTHENTKSDDKICEDDNSNGKNSKNLNLENKNSILETQGNGKSDENICENDNSNGKDTKTLDLECTNSTVDIEENKKSEDNICEDDNGKNNTQENKNDDKSDDNIDEGDNSTGKNSKTKVNFKSDFIAVCLDSNKNSQDDNNKDKPAKTQSNPGRICDTSVLQEETSDEDVNSNKCKEENDKEEIEKEERKEVITEYYDVNCCEESSPSESVPEEEEEECKDDKDVDDFSQGGQSCDQEEKNPDNSTKKSNSSTKKNNNSTKKSDNSKKNSDNLSTKSNHSVKEVKEQQPTDNDNPESCEELADDDKSFTTNENFFNIHGTLSGTLEFSSLAEDKEIQKELSTSPKSSKPLIVPKTSEDETSCESKHTNEYPEQLIEQSEQSQQCTQNSSCTKKEVTSADLIEDEDKNKCSSHKNKVGSTSVEQVEINTTRISKEKIDKKEDQVQPANKESKEKAKGEDQSDENGNGNGSEEKLANYRNHYQFDEMDSEEYQKFSDNVCTTE